MKAVFIISRNTPGPRVQLKIPIYNKPWQYKVYGTTLAIFLEEPVKNEAVIIMETIRQRRSVRRFRRDVVEKEKIDLLIESVRWAPSAGNAQPWEIVIITNTATIQTLKTVMTGVMGNMEEGPLLILLCRNTQKETAWTGYDIGCALQNILLCAHSIGLGACAIGGFDEEMIGRLLDLPAHAAPCLFVTAGYPARSAATPSRRDVKDIVLKEV